MTIYVDQITHYGNRGKWCHMMTDSDDLDELHEFAVQIGLKKEWFQQKSAPHYDLRPSKRRLAINKGAQEVSSLDMVRRCHPRYKTRGVSQDV